MTTLDQEQQRLKAEMDARKARHPYPGGWRPHCRSTFLEDFAVRYIPANTIPSETCLNDDFLMIGSRFGVRTPGMPNGLRSAVRVINGRLYALRGWIADNITAGWALHSVSSFVKRHREIRRIDAEVNALFYDVEDVVVAVGVMRKSRSDIYLRPSVARVLQGSGSINDKLLAFVENGAE